MSELRKGVINLVDSKEKKLQTAQVEGLRGELNDKVETYQNYGMTAHPMPCDPNGEGAEVIYANLGSSTMRTIIATDDRRFRCTKTKQGDVVLYSNHDKQKAEHSDATHRIAFTDDGGKDFRIIAKTNDAWLELKSDHSITAKNKKGSIVLAGNGDITKITPNFKLTADTNTIIGKTSITGDTVDVKGKTSITGETVDVKGKTSVSGASFVVTAPSDGISFTGPSFKFNGHDVLTTDPSTAPTDDWHNTNPPSSSPTLGAISIAPSVSGTNDATLNWNYTQGALKAESFTLFVEKGLTVPTAASEVFATLSAGYSAYRAVGLPADQTYSIGIVANRNCIEGVKSTPIVTGWVINGGPVNVHLDLLNGTLVSDITSSMVNYNTSNDQNGDPISAPTNVQITSVMNTNGSADVTMTWDWSGNEADIDGFGILVHTGTTNVFYALGNASDNVYTVYANARSKTWYGVDTTKWYTAGVLAFRAVNKSVSSNGLIISSLTQSATYQPNPTPDISITINGMPASSITSNIVNFNTLNDMDGSAVAAPSTVLVTHVMNTNGSADVTVSWAWTGNEADIDGFGIYTYTSNTSDVHTINVATDYVFPTLAKTRSRTFYGIDATKWYTAGIIAYRAVAKSVSSSGFILSSCIQASPYQPNSAPSITALINGIPAAQITSGIANFNLLNDMNGAAINAPANINVTSTQNSNGSCDVNMTWDWTGVNSDIDGFGIYIYAATTNAAHSVNQYNTDTVYITRSDARSYTWLGVDSTKWYTAHLVAYRSVNTTVSASGFVASSFVLFGPYQPNATPNMALLINGVSPSTITSAITNYNTSNDQNSSAINAPTGLTVSSVNNSNGSSDVTLSWSWTGNDADIDGFGIYAYAGNTNAAHTINTATDTVHWAKPGARSRTWYGIDATKWYTAGVVAYRAVNHTVSSSGFVVSTIPQISPYQPNSTPNITTTINGVSATTLTTQASAGNTAANDTATFRTSGAPTNAPVYGGIFSTAQSANGCANVTVWWTYTQGTIPADKFYIYVNESTSPPTTASNMVATVDASARQYVFVGVPMDKAYAVGITAARTTSSGVYQSPITTGWSQSGTGISIAATSVLWSGVTGAGKPVDYATKNQSLSGTGTPSGGTTGDTYYNPSTGALWINVGGTWIASADKTNLNTAANISGQGSFATLSSLTAGNHTSYIGYQALGDSVLSSLSAAKIAAGTLAAGVIYGGSISCNQLTAGTISTGTLDSSGYVKVSGSVSAPSGACAVYANSSVSAAIGTYSPGAVWGVIGTSANNSGSGVYGYNSGSGQGLYGYSQYGYSVYASGSLNCQGASYFSGGMQIYSTCNVSGQIWTGTTGQVSNLNSTYLQGYTPSSFASSSHTHSGLIPVILTNGTSCTPSNGFQLLFDGSMSGSYRTYGSGNVVWIGVTSDERLKKDINPDTLGLDFVSKLTPKTFRMKDNTLIKHHGFIAQDVHQLNELTNDDSLKVMNEDGMLGVNYVALIAPLVNCIKELKKRIEVLEARP